MSIEVGTNGDPDNPVYESLTMEIKNTGSDAVSGAKVSYFINDEFVFEETINESIAARETYTHSFSQVNGFTGGMDHLIYGVVSLPSDENLNDDVAKTFIDDQLTDIDEIDIQAFRIFPNPSAGNFNVELSPSFLNGQLSVMDVQGRVILQRKIDQTNMQVEVETKGVYMLNISTVEQETLIKKLVVQ